MNYIKAFISFTCTLIYPNYHKTSKEYDETQS